MSTGQSGAMSTNVLVMGFILPHASFSRITIRGHRVAAIDYENRNGRVRNSVCTGLLFYGSREDELPEVSASFRAL
jgi:hypothetical protein